MSKPIYEKPILIRHQTGQINKFSRAGSMRPLDNIEGVPIAHLVEKYGSPLFVFSEKKMVERYRDLRDAFAQRGVRARIAWSYKTNYLDGVCRVFHREGAYAEVVSIFEYEKALRLGIPPERIHFNGPYKTESVLERVLPTGAHVHLDGFDEMLLAEQVAERLGIRPKVSIRINMGVDSIPEWRRFGFNLESGQARDAVMRLFNKNRLDLEGVHCHLGTFITEPDAYRQEAANLALFANEIRKSHGVVLSFIDIGGGFASANSLKGQYLPGEQVAPPFSRYAEAIAEGLSQLIYSPSEMPTIVLETGRALIDEAGTLIATVLANKRLPDGRRAVIVDAGVNILFTSFWYNHDIVPCQPFGYETEPSTIFGPLCMNIDVLRDTVQFPGMKVGERIAVRTVGAYNVTQWMQFITYRPAVVMIGLNGGDAILRRREDLDSIVGQEEIPEWLQIKSAD